VIKLTFCLRRRPELSLQEFQRYWLENHGPLVRRHAATLKIKRYVQLHTLDHPSNGVLRGSREAGEAYDGVAELWWDSPDDLSAATATEKGRVAAQELLEDERRFIDLKRSSLWLGEEHEIVGR